MWKKWVTLAQWASIVGVVGYAVLYLDVQDELGNTTVFESARKWWGDATSSPRNERARNVEGDQTQAQKG